MTAFLLRFRRANPQLRLFLFATVLAGAAGGVFETTFNNFLNDTFSIRADARGFLEFPRELPGFLTALCAGALFFLPETVIAALATLLIGLGMLGLGVWGQSWNAMLAFMVVWSLGTHLSMPVGSSIGMDLAEGNRKGRRLGQISGARIAAAFIGCGLVWATMRHRERCYGFTFVAGGVLAIVGAAVLACMRMPGAHLRRPKFVWHRRYWLFYTLSLLYGARKQIFITFGPWVLVKLFHQPATVFAQLWIASAVLGVASQPALGRAVDRFGERAVLMADAVGVFAVCAGYAFAYLIPNHTAALALLFACYVGDQLLMGSGMARSTYLSRIAVKPEHVSPTLSLGVSIDHVVSMTIPVAAGVLWVARGHTAVFLAAAGIAVLMLVFSAMVRAPGTAPVPVQADGAAE